MRSPRTVSRSLALAALVAAALVAGCDDGSTGTLATGVVQETNMPCTDQTCTCDLPDHYVRQLTRSCDGMLANLSICAEAPVCDEVLNQIIAEVMACTEPASPFEIDTSACPTR